MRSSLNCGVDIGSTNAKVLLIDEQGRTVWSRSVPVPRVAHEQGPVTDALALVEALERLIVEGWTTTGAAAPLRAICTTGVGEDGLTVDAQLNPTDVAIPWFDRRAASEASELARALGHDLRPGLTIDSTRTAAKWLWLRRHRHGALDQAFLWVALTDFPAVHWARQPFMSQSLAARTGCYDVFSRQWLAGHLEAAQAPRLPMLMTAGQILGPVMSPRLLASGAASRDTLVVCGGHDHPIAATVVRHMDPDALVDSLGTANLVYGETADTTPRADPYVAFSVPALGNPGLACLGVFEFSAAVDRLRVAGHGQSLSDFLAAPEPSGLAGDASAVIAQLRASLQAAGRSAVATGDPQMASATPDVRTMLEANCFYARRMLDAVRRAGTAGASVFCVGGWSRSPALLRLRASIFGEALTAVDEQELTALGAALLARSAALPGAVDALARPLRKVHPDPALARHYEREYPAVTDALMSMMGA